MPHLSGFFKRLNEEDKKKSDDVENELLKCIELNKTNLRYMMIKKFKDVLTYLKTILKEIGKLLMIRELEKNKKIK